ncbi:patatin family protein [Vineibacter terrae]|uniref:Patatin family protein n=1 Tax=Vineibacter terrae TaxID=2586908 RepID=A0A5C8PMM8_9HYPH|nr:patatin-like phospholipase family protein [Vineibacter terrae]TXL75648.1 patatin family protein [Vineibacter terrae]
MLLLSACSTPVRQAAVPKELQIEAEVPGMPGVRYFAREHSALLLHDAFESIQREKAQLKSAGGHGQLPPTQFLAISGGGEDGAFGAGLLLGWTASGARPEFKLVTGVSTGALTAPFAFLGPRYDDKLRWIYTEVTSKDILERRWLLAALLDDALSDTTPLKRLVQKFMNAEMMQDIAAENAKGRLLLIGTTNLDGRRGVIWNIGKIAASGHPRALNLIQDILVASAAIPGVFPPIMFDVEAGGRRYQEMHVDGGASAQVFAYPPLFGLGDEAKARGVVRGRRIYVIRNARLDADWEQVDRRALSIAGRSIAALIQNQGVGDLYRIYVTSRRDKVDFNLAFIPATFKTPLKEPFDKAYMNELFKIGYDLGARGYRWIKVPPGLETSGPVAEP